MAELAKILWKQFKKQTDVDFVFKFMDENDEDKVLEEIGVHSIVLTSQSPVFKVMLTGKLKEKSPLVLKDTTPDIFKKFLRVLYYQETSVFSLEDAHGFYYLGSKYDFPKGISIAKKYMMENIDFTNVTSVYECAQVFDDMDLETANWEFLEKFILKTMKGLECLGGKQLQTKDECSFEIIETPEQALKTLKGHVEDICNERDVKKKIGCSIGLIKSLIKEMQKIFRLVVPNESFLVVTRLQQSNGQLSNFEKLNRFYNEDLKCMFCTANHKLVECPVNSFGASLYKKYKHDDLTTYNVEDITILYNNLKSKLPA